MIAWTIIKWIIGILIVFFIVWFLFFGPGKAFLTWLGRGALPEQAQEQGENNFDILIENIKNCQSISDTNCLCEGFPNWPASFARNSKLTFSENGKATNINWSYKKKVYRNATVDSKFNAIFPDKKEIEYGPKKEIDFSKEPPSVVQEGLKKLLGKKPSIITDKIYKSKDSIYFIISFNPEEKLKEAEWHECKAA